MKDQNDNKTQDWCEEYIAPTLTQVRQALSNLAKQKGRPDYELCTAKEVKTAFECGIHHALIGELIPLIDFTKKEAEKPVKPKVLRVSQARLARKRYYPSSEQVVEIVRWLNQSGIKLIDIAAKADCRYSSLSRIRTGDKKFTLDLYNKIMKARKELEGVAV